MNEQDLALATALINQFEIVLILEHFDRDLVQLQKLLGWNIKYLGQAKKSGSGGKQISFTSAQETLIKQRNTLDYEFYSHACSLAEEISTKFGVQIFKRIFVSISRCSTILFPPFVISPENGKELRNGQASCSLELNFCTPPGPIN
jgi:hypothetical protein